MGPIARYAGAHHAGAHHAIAYHATHHAGAKHAGTHHAGAHHADTRGAVRHNASDGRCVRDEAPERASPDALSTSDHG